MKTIASLLVGAKKQDVRAFAGYVHSPLLRGELSWCIEPIHRR